jgi:hypothetical protein
MKQDVGYLMLVVGYDLAARGLPRETFLKLTVNFCNFSAAHFSNMAVIKKKKKKNRRYLFCLSNVRVFLEIKKKC